MRRLALLVLAMLVPACHSTSQLVVGILTNLPVPAKLTSARLEASRNGVLVDQQFWMLSGIQSVDYTLPGTFGYYSTRGGTPELELELAGFLGDTQVLTRRSQVQLVLDEQLFQRMALVGSCESVSCPAGQGCVEGVCRSDAIDARTLPRYDESLARVVRCDSGSDFIDTATCSTGTCARLPISGPACAPSEECREGTCYRKAAAP